MPTRRGSGAGGTRPRWPGRWWLVGAVVLVLACIARLVHPHGPFGDTAYLAATVGAAPIAWLGTRRRPPGSRDRSAAVLLAVAVSATAVAEVVYLGYGWFLDQVPDASLADIPWLSSYVAMAAGIVLLSAGRDGRRGIDVDALLDAAAAATVGVLLVWEVAIAPTMADGAVPAWVRLIWASYPILDAALLGLLVRTAVDRRRRAAVGPWLAAGVACWLVSDFAYAYLISTGRQATWLDMGWMLGAALLARAAWPPAPPADHGDAAAATPADERGGVRAAFAVLVVPLLLPAGVEVAGRLRGFDPDPFPLAVGSVALVAVLLTRISRLVAREEAATADLRLRKRRFAALAANSSDAATIVAADGRITFESPRFAALLGRPGAPTGDRPLPALAPPHAASELQVLLARSLADPGATVHGELWVPGPGGPDGDRWLGVRLVSRVDDPAVAGVVVNLHDITDRKRAEEDLIHQAFHDLLTGLANRALYRDRLDQALRRAGRDGTAAVIYLDLDGFKHVNDRLGHDVGDRLLQEVARRLVSSVRPGDTVARLGGDEFAILVVEADRALDVAEAASERVLRCLADPIALDGFELAVSASLGIAIGGEGASATEVLRNADLAMYKAKSSGKGRWVVFDQAMSTAALERLQLESDLGAALDLDQLRLVYQPVVRLDGGRIVGFEALLRWDHPVLGEIPPDRFIPIAEETGAIVAIGRWVLIEACRAAGRLEPAAGGPLSMAVNVSARQLASASLVADVREALEAAGLAPGRLVLEMTESVLVTDAATVAERLGELRDLGVRLAIDDFGTGYSSLSYLRQFPIDILKIDRSFIGSITDGEALPPILRGLLDLGRTLALETVAEGVERDVQRARLRDERCDLAQGHLFAEPLDEAEARALLGAPDRGPRLPSA